MVVCCPAHLQPHYLGEIGASGEVLLTDQDTAGPSAIRMALSRDAGGAVFSISGDLDLVFYTSGVTGAPKAVQKNIRQLDAEAAVLEGVWPGGAQRVFGTVSHQHIYGMLFACFGLCVPAAHRRTNRRNIGSMSQDTYRRDPRWSPALPISRDYPMPQCWPMRRRALSFRQAARCRFRQPMRPKRTWAFARLRSLGVRRRAASPGVEQTGKEALWTLLPGVGARSTENGGLIVRSPFTKSGEPIETGDVVSFVGEKFQLLGRGDRIAKIDGKRVSLPRVKEALSALPIVDDAAAIDLPTRKGALGAIVQLSASGQDLLKAKGAFRLSRELRSALAERLEPAERPKYWRFGIIPTNQQGKRVQDLLRAAFDRTSPKLLGRGVVKSVDPDAAIQIEFTKGHALVRGAFSQSAGVGRYRSGSHRRAVGRERVGLEAAGRKLVAVEIPPNIATGRHRATSAGSVAAKAAAEIRLPPGRCDRIGGNDRGRRA